MKYPKLALTGVAALTALMLACGKSSTPASPVSPLAASLAESGPSGETLKIAAPTLLSPANGAQLDTLPTLTWSGAQGTYASFAVNYEVALFDPTGKTLVDTTVTTTSYTVTMQLDYAVIDTWRVRATYQGANGPWSGTFSFRTPTGGYIKASEVFDPLTNGKTVGTISGPTQFINGQGIKLLDQTAHVTYPIATTLTAGQFSLMEMGADEGTPGGKRKVMAMQEGTGDITDNDYRATIEVRGTDAGTSAGDVSCRIITGDATDTGRIFDCNRINYNWDSTRWYFFQFTWQTGTAELTIRKDGPTGSVMYDQVLHTGSHPYNPQPQVIYIGAPVGRAGTADASVPNMIVKDLWFSAGPRPAFPASLLPGPPH